MQITLNQDEISEAVQDYVRSQINIAANQTIAIDFTAGRSPAGITASLDIRAAPTNAAPVTAAPVTAAPVAETKTETRKAAAPKAEPKPKPEPQVDETDPAPTMTTEEAVAAISTGEERTDPADDAQDEAPVQQEAETQVEQAEEPAPKAIKKTSPFAKLGKPDPAPETAPAAEEEKTGRSIFSKREPA